MPDNAERLPVHEYTFKPKGAFIRLIAVSCIHVGHKKFNEAKIRSYLEYIHNTPDTYAVMLGDTIENVLPETAMRHPGSMHEQVMSVEQQREYAATLLRPLAKAGKLLVWTESNHSIRSWYAAGFSVEQWLAQALDVPFVGPDALLKLNVGEQKYIVHATHGVGAATSLPSVFGKLLSQASRVEGADVYIRGHHHKKVLADMSTIDAASGQLKKKVLAATGCFMDYFDGYGHRAGYPPVDIGCIKVKLYKKRWDIHATL